MVDLLVLRGQTHLILLMYNPINKDSFNPFHTPPKHSCCKHDGNGMLDLGCDVASWTAIHGSGSGKELHAPERSEASDTVNLVPVIRTITVL